MESVFIAPSSMIGEAVIRMHPNIKTNSDSIGTFYYNIWQVLMPVMVV